MASEETGRTIRIGQHVTVTTRRSRKPAANKLSTDRVVDVAIGQLRKNGYDAVTMRSIARELGTGPASLYAHVANRAELDQLVVGRVAAQWEIPDPDPAVWDVQLADSLKGLLAIYQENPGVARCSMGMIPTEHDLLAVTERLLALLAAGGVPDQYCAWFVDVASLFVSSVAMEEDIWRERASEAIAAGRDRSELEDAEVAGVRHVFETLPPDEFPLLLAMAATMTTGSGEERFAFGVDLLVSGLKALSERAARHPG
ncbi:MAG: TetR/AcrR family transcriptional regulator [Marmoricola sp.]